MKALVYIPLTHGKFSVIDFRDYEMASLFKWHVDVCKSTCYAKTNLPLGGKQRTLSLHSLIMAPAAGLEVHHINGDGLDNRRVNLRNVTPQEHAQGPKKKKAGASSRFRGVSWTKANRKWSAHVTLNRKQQFLGYFLCEEAAARAYDKKAAELFGGHAQLNFPKQNV